MLSYEKILFIWVFCLVVLMFVQQPVPEQFVYTVSTLTLVITALLLQMEQVPISFWLAWFLTVQVSLCFEASDYRASYKVKIITPLWDLAGVIFDHVLQTCAIIWVMLELAVLTFICVGFCVYILLFLLGASYTWWTFLYICVGVTFIIWMYLGSMSNL